YVVAVLGQSRALGVHHQRPVDDQSGVAVGDGDAGDGGRVQDNGPFAGTDRLVAGDGAGNGRLIGVDAEHLNEQRLDRHGEDHFDILRVAGVRALNGRNVDGVGVAGVENQSGRVA